jgi:hypothetical protein
MFFLFLGLLPSLGAFIHQSLKFKESKLLRIQDAVEIKHFSLFCLLTD